MDAPPQSSASMDPNLHSMPSVEEVRTDTISRLGFGNPHSGKNKRKMALIAICAMALAMIVGFSAAIIQKNRAFRNSKKAAAWDPEGIAEPEDESLSNLRSESRLDDVIDFLSVTISDKALFENKSTPQYKAARWIADQDFMEVEIPEDPNNYDDDFEFVQRYIMAVFYFAMDGVNWRYKAYFMSDYSVCEWNMDFYEAVPGQEDDDWVYGVQCGDNGAISTIFMTSNRLQGELPPELGDLLDLDHISLYNNMIGGNFPPRMQYLVDLDFVAIESNRMTGPLPDWIGKSWTQLEFLALGDNQFTGPIPDLTGLDYLVELALDSNQFTGTVDAFNALPFIESLFLNDNEFDGWFGDETWSDLDFLTTVDLSSNKVTGYVPDWIYGLETVDLHDNFLNTTIPEVPAADDSPMLFFSLFGNDITGPIPDSIGNLPALTHLDLSDNYFTGMIPDFYFLSNLEVLYLTDNDLAVQEFPDLSASTYMRELGLGDCQLTGTIPDWLGDSLADLSVLDLRDNALSGTIPENLGYLEDIEYLLLNYNMLTGQVPDFSYCEYLAVLYIDNNSFDDDTLVGSLENVCNAKPEGLYAMVANCDIECTCCTECCKADDQDCNMWDESLRLSDAADREQFLFQEDKIFDQATNVSE